MRLRGVRPKSERRRKRRGRKEGEELARARTGGSERDRPTERRAKERRRQTKRADRLDSGGGGWKLRSLLDAIDRSIDRPIGGQRQVADRVRTYTMHLLRTIDQSGGK